MTLSGSLDPPEGAQAGVGLGEEAFDGSQKGDKGMEHAAFQMAGSLMAAAPPVLIYAFLMDYYIAGLTAGATKG